MGMITICMITCPGGATSLYIPLCTAEVACIQTYGGPHVRSTTATACGGDHVWAHTRLNSTVIFGGASGHPPLLDVRQRGEEHADDRHNGQAG
eukprot:10035418-Heterocapsa_arctica.AAC.1